MTERILRIVAGPSSLQPRKGFNWMAVSWGGPDEPVTRSCSYCEAPLDEDDVPLMLFCSDGWCARFCANCQSRWWGLL